MEDLKLWPLEKNIGQNFHNIGFGSDFFDMTQKHKQQKKK